MTVNDNIKQYAEELAQSTAVTGTPAVSARPAAHFLAGMWIGLMSVAFGAHAIQLLRAHDLKGFGSQIVVLVPVALALISLFVGKVRWSYHLAVLGLCDSKGFSRLLLAPAVSIRIHLLTRANSARLTIGLRPADRD
jgi:hypothetical protein